MTDIEAVSLWGDCKRLAEELGLHVEVVINGTRLTIMYCNKETQIDWESPDITHAWAYLNGIKWGRAND